MNCMMHGNGITDNAPAIQKLRDCGTTMVYLPSAEKPYEIRKTL